MLEMSNVCYKIFLAMSMLDINQYLNYANGLLNYAEIQNILQNTCGTAFIYCLSTMTNSL
jgi:predicted component of type VI protein secretion system